MTVRTRRQLFTPMRLIMPLLWMVMVFYGAYHALHGERGLYALWRDQRELVVLRAEMEATKTEREKTEMRVSHLRDSSLDRDLLDEQTRRMTGLMKRGEVMILTGE